MESKEEGTPFENDCPLFVKAVLQEVLMNYPLWTIISAEKEEWGPPDSPENKAATAKLSDYLRTHGFFQIKVTIHRKGKDPGMGFFVNHVSEGTARKIATEFGQQHLLVCRGLVLKDGCCLRADHNRDTFQKEAEKQDCYYKFSNGLSFSIHLDQSRKQSNPL